MWLMTARSIANRPLVNVRMYSRYDYDELHAYDGSSYGLDDARIVIARSGIRLRDVNIMYRHLTPTQQANFRFDDWPMWSLISMDAEHIYTEADLEDSAVPERGLRLAYLRRESTIFCWRVSTSNMTPSLGSCEVRL